jgi:hypothetical protein
VKKKKNTAQEPDRSLDDYQPKAAKLARIFAENWKKLADLGYSPIPLYPAGTIKNGVDRSKSPCIKEWSNHCGTPMTEDDVASALRHRADAEIGVCGGYNGLVGVDIDTLDRNLQKRILEILPEATARIGNPQKAGLLLFRWAGAEMRLIKSSRTKTAV